MGDIIQPSKRIDCYGNERDMDTPYEQGVYYSVIGLYLSDNPYDINDEFNYCRFQQRFNEHKSGKLKSRTINHD